MLAGLGDDTLLESILEPLHRCHVTHQPQGVLSCVNARQGWPSPRGPGMISEVSQEEVGCICIILSYIIIIAYRAGYILKAVWHSQDCKAQPQNSLAGSRGPPITTPVLGHP